MPKLRPITLAPLPKFITICRAVFSPLMLDDDLGKPWRRSDDVSFWLSRSAHSLGLIVLFRQKMYGQNKVCVWIPNFFCNSSLKPLRDLGVELIFYPVNSNLYPDLELCKPLVDSNGLDIFVLVHYFGQAKRLDDVSIFCKKHGAYLVEDASHVFLPIKGVGEVGDFVFYSPHKHLAIPDGAILVVRKYGPHEVGSKKSSIGILQETINEIFNSSKNRKLTAYTWLLKRIIQSLGFRRSIVCTPYHEDVLSQSNNFDDPKMSNLAKRLLNAQLNDLINISKIRIKNAIKWNVVIRWLTSASVAPSYKWVSTMDTPYLASFKFPCIEVSEKLFHNLIKLGVPALTWPDMPPEVSSSISYSDSIAISLRNQQFYLPVHQSLPKKFQLPVVKHEINSLSKTWNVRILSFDEWEKYWALCSETNLLQSWQYGEAKYFSEGWKPLRFLIVDANGEPIALAQVLTKSWPIVGGIARLNRGPIFFYNKSLEKNSLHMLVTVQAIIQEMSRRNCRVFQIAPEYYESDEIDIELKSLGMKKLSYSAWESGKISLALDENALLMSFEGTWRNSMRKGERLGVIVRKFAQDEYSVNLLIKQYARFKSIRGFDGISEKLLHQLSLQKGREWCFTVFTASKEGAHDSEAPIGLVMTIRSGDTAIYLVGISDEIGRKMQVNSVLLWHAIISAKRDGCKWFDIGGLNQETPKGIGNFKRGLNAIPYRLIGEYRKFMISI